MSNQSEMTKQSREYREAFVYKKTGLTYTIVGMIAAVAGIWWCTYSYFEKPASDISWHFAPAVVVVGVLLCIWGVLENIHQALTQKQLQDEYHWKYGRSYPTSEGK